MRVKSSGSYELLKTMPGTYKHYMYLLLSASLEVKLTGKR